jgi:hypothetical protein
MVLKQHTLKLYHRNILTGEDFINRDQLNVLDTNLNQDMTRLLVLALLMINSDLKFKGGFLMVCNDEFCISKFELTRCHFSYIGMSLFNLIDFHTALNRTV